MTCWTNNHDERESVFKTAALIQLRAIESRPRDANPLLQRQEIAF